MTDTEPSQLTLLGQAVANLDQYEKLALATFLTWTSNPIFQDQSLVIPEVKITRPELAKACDLAREFPSATKIFFAIELLELQIDRDEFEEENEEDDGDGLPDPDDYEEDDDDYYGVDVPGFDEEV